MTAPMRRVKYREYRAGCVLITLVCGHSAAVADDRDVAHRCHDCAPVPA